MICAFLNVKWGLISGWEISTAYYKSLLPITLSMVLAIILLELRGFLYAGCTVFFLGTDLF